MIWHSTSDSQVQPWPFTRSFLVAIDVDGHCFVKEGEHTRKGLRAKGINVEPYAWAYMPKPPTQKELRS